MLLTMWELQKFTRFWHSLFLQRLIWSSFQKTVFIITIKRLLTNILRNGFMKLYRDFCHFVMAIIWVIVCLIIWHRSLVILEIENGQSLNFLMISNRLFFWHYVSVSLLFHFLIWLQFTPVIYINLFTTDTFGIFQYNDIWRT